MGLSEFAFIEGLVGILALAFTGWAGVVWKASRHLTEKFGELNIELNRFMVSVEHRLTRLESIEDRLLELEKVMAQLAKTQRNDGTFHTHSD